MTRTLENVVVRQTGSVAKLKGGIRAWQPTSCNFYFISQFVV